MKRRNPRSRPEIAIVEMLEKRALLSSAAIASAVSHDSPATSPQEGLLANLSSATSVTASTVPSNGDLNPYGTAFVPSSYSNGGSLQAGNLLVSNFNSSSNLQGTGTTIVQVTPSGQTSTFYQGPAGLGLTTALGVLPQGYVIVGNLPTTDGTGATAQQGSLLIINKDGQLVATLKNANLLDGPWDLTIQSQGSTAHVFVSNALNGTVSRIDLSVPSDGTSKPQVTSEVQIASGYKHRTDPTALLLGPTGLAFNSQTDTLFVASTANNAIYAVPNAAHRKSSGGTGLLVYNNPAHLHGPLGMKFAPNGDLIVSNGDAVNPNSSQNSELVELTESGKFVAQYQVDSVAGSAFGIAIQNQQGKTVFAAVDDTTNTVTIWTLHRDSDNDFDAD